MKLLKYLFPLVTLSFLIMLMIGVEFLTLKRSFLILFGILISYAIFRKSDRDNSARNNQRWKCYKEPVSTVGWNAFDKCKEWLPFPHSQSCINKIYVKNIKLIDFQLVSNKMIICNCQKRTFCLSGRNVKIVYPQTWFWSEIWFYCFSFNHYFCHPYFWAN